MLDQKDRDAAGANPHQELAQRGFLGCVHSGGRLVQRKQPRIGGERPRDLEAALIPVRERARQVVRVAVDADLVEQLPGAAADRGLLGAGAPRAQHRVERIGVRAYVASDHHVLERRHVRKQANVLEGARDPGLCHPMRIGRPVRMTAQLERARIGCHEAGQHVEESRLAGAVGPDQPVDLALVDLDLDARQRLQASKALVDRTGPQHALSHFGIPPLPRRGRCRTRAAILVRATATVPGAGTA